jgi:hypothetical protein
MAILNDMLYWLYSIPPVYWLSQQPIGFVFFAAVFAVLLIAGYRGTRGPEV